MLSANRKLVMVRPAMLTVHSASSNTSDIIVSRKMLKSVGDIAPLADTYCSVEPFSNIAIDENCAGSPFEYTFRILAVLHEPSCCRCYIVS